MTFDPNADISRGRVSRRGRTAGITAAGGGIGVVVIFLLSQLFGVDLSAFVGGGQAGGGATGGEEIALEECRTGADANASVECRMKGAAASLDQYWAAAAPEVGIAYASPQNVVLFEDQVSTGCGAASAATGPFYCPPDETIYMDVDFFGELRTRFGSSGGPLAEMYVVAHEWGHHVQNLAGILDATRDGLTGADSNAVRTELQADCFAGAWAGDASDPREVGGTPLLEPVTEAQVADALSAAAAVGDDRIQQAAQGEVSPHTFTHGTSEQRQRWFTAGYERGAAACDTFSVPAGGL
ncbi:KPN_02809 family neutral zinc metallopeptidase [Agromyces archimandritae]|uniref:Neutral zinc metallopeptidase n=1 Tax=Agromyces archimandritae TaxID=2781962 RepID=A0A975FNX1_9MICO|nr:neutral zinc metallopeptidase [Agromyces archimandritae]QTX05589.1 neutral zinc metallopeptidase [Agromyces archimandritae]